MVILMVIPYCPRVCTCRIRVENALKTRVIRTVFLTRIPNSQSPLIIDNALNCSKTHLPVHQPIQLIYQRELTFITV